MPATEHLMKLNARVTDCLVQDFENDARCEEILRRLQADITVVFAALVKAHETEKRVIEQSRDFWYRSYKWIAGQGEMP